MVENEFDPTQPLSGVRIVEAAQMISAPMATSLLCDQGAEVIKVEAPSGDRMRGLGDIRNGIGSVFHCCNRGKKSVTLDTKTEEGRDTLRRLIATADVFVQNFRPGAAERMRVGPEEMLADNPGLIYVSVSGFGATGPYADQMVYDFVIQGVSGSAALEGSGGEDGTRPRLTKNLIIDKATALTASQAITAALFHRQRSGRGQHVEINMLEAGLQFFWPDGMWNHTYQGDDVHVMPHMAANYDVRPTRDGFVTLNLGTNSTWGRLCAAVDPSLEDDPRFATYNDRQKHARELAGAVDDVLTTLTTEEVLARFREHDLPGGPVVELDSVHLDPQIVHNESILERESSSAGRLRDTRPAARFDERRSPQPGHAPRLGEHTSEVLADLER